MLPHVLRVIRWLLPQPLFFSTLRVGLLSVLSGKGSLATASLVLTLITCYVRKSVDRLGLDKSRRHPTLPVHSCASVSARVRSCIVGRVARLMRNLACLTALGVVTAP